MGNVEIKVDAHKDSLGYANIRMQDVAQMARQLSDTLKEAGLPTDSLDFFEGAFSKTMMEIQVRLDEDAVESGCGYPDGEIIDLGEIDLS